MMPTAIIRLQIFAFPGNHDGMVSSLNTQTPTLKAFLTENFCAAGQ